MAEDQQVPTNFSAETIASLRETLTAESSPLAARFRALFSLKHIATVPEATDPQRISAIDSIAAAFASPSALLKHELAYCLGQTRNAAAVPHLRGVLSDRAQDDMCRHEAAEALAAVGDEGSLPLLKERLADHTEEVVVRETCEIAIQRLEWEHGQQRASENLKNR